MLLNVPGILYSLEPFRYGEIAQGVTVTAGLSLHWGCRDLQFNLAVIYFLCQTMSGQEVLKWSYSIAESVSLVAVPYIDHGQSDLILRRIFEGFWNPSDDIYSTLLSGVYWIIDDKLIFLEQGHSPNYLGLCLKMRALYFKQTNKPSPQTCLMLETSWLGESLPHLSLGCGEWWTCEEQRMKAVRTEVQLMVLRLWAVCFVHL